MCPTPALPFKLWFCSRFPLDRIKCEFGTTGADHPDRASWVDAVASSIQARGLVNPLLIFNHEGPLNEFRLKCGKNRLLALRKLGWTHAPVIGTGEPPPTAWHFRFLTLDEANSTYIRDGRLEPSSQGLRMADNKHPLEWKTPLDDASVRPALEASRNTSLDEAVQGRSGG